MRVESSYPTPVQGVSTLAPRNRMEGQAAAQINMRSDPVNKLTRRPPMTWETVLLTEESGENIHFHKYERDGKTYRLLLDKQNNRIHCYINKEFIETVFLSDVYVDTNMVSQTVDHMTYFVNTDRVVTMLPDTDDASISKTSHINVTSALNYSETVKVNITLHTAARYSVSYTIPALGVVSPDYDAADAARATKKVAEELATLIAAGHANVSAIALGSTVAVWNNTDTNEWLNVEIESGQGDKSCVPFNRIVENITGIPKYARVGTRITVRPDPTTDKGVYYLEAERVADIASGLILEEVVWAESRSPTEPYAFDPATLPIRCDFDGTNFTVSTLQLKDRDRGDDESNAPPDFVGKTIRNLSYFQKRLALLTENNLMLSETEDPDNFWKQSAVQLLVTDRVAISSSAVGIGQLEQIIPHNRDLLVIATNGQFKVDGAGGITPQTASMALTTSYDVVTDIAPVAMGNSVYLPISYGSSSGLQEYTGQQNTSQDKGLSITHHVISYMAGRPKLLVASPNLEMIAYVTEDSEEDELFVYEQYTNSKGERAQKSWSTWKFSGDTRIRSIEFKEDRLTLIVAEGNNLVLKELAMYSKVATGEDEVYLDDLLELDTDGSRAVVPVNYPLDDLVVVRGEGTEFEQETVDFTVDGQVLNFEESIGLGKVYVGRRYRSSYTPTRPFQHDEKGIPVTTDKIRVRDFIIALVDTHTLTMSIDSPFTITDDQVFVARRLGGLSGILGEHHTYSGDVKFSFSEDAEFASATFFTDSHTGVTIAGISWEGLYYKTARRM